MDDCLSSTTKLQMGIISPKQRTAVAKALIALLLIILSPILILVVLLHLLWGAILYLAIWLTWRKQLVVFVHSNSPNWKAYIEGEILPYLPSHAVILNWSERKRWTSSLSVLAFRYFGGYRNFNPMAMVFRPFHRVKLYRFFEAFKDFKHGDPKRVEDLKRKLFEDLGI